MRFDSHRVVHGAVLDAPAVTGTKAALHPTLAPDEICATIEIKINDVKPVMAGTRLCRIELVNRGTSLANLDARIHRDGVLVAQAHGNHAIFKPRPARVARGRPVRASSFCRKAAAGCSGWESGQTVDARERFRDVSGRCSVFC